jgi:hypothetical protein
MIGVNMREILAYNHIKEYIDTHYEKILEDKEIIALELGCLTDRDMSTFTPAVQRGLVAIAILAGAADVARKFCKEYSISLETVFNSYESVLNRVSGSNRFLLDFITSELEDYLKNNEFYLVENREAVLQTINDIKDSELLTLRPYYRKSLVVLIVALGAEIEFIKRLCIIFGLDLADVLCDFVLTDRRITRHFLKFREFINPEIVQYQLEQHTHVSHIFYLTKDINNFTDILPLLEFLWKEYTAKLDMGLSRPAVKASLSGFFEHVIASAYTFRRQLKFVTLTHKDWDNVDIQNLFATLPRDDLESVLEQLFYEDFDLLIKIMSKYGPLEVNQTTIATITDEQILGMLDAINQSYEYKHRQDSYNLNKVANTMSNIFLSNRMTKEICKNHWDKVAIYLSSSDYFKTEEILTSCNVSLKEALEYMGR